VLDASAALVASARFWLAAESKSVATSAAMLTLASNGCDFAHSASAATLQNQQSGV